MEARRCEACGIDLLPAETREGGTRCFRCREKEKETPMGKETCKEAGCGRPISMAKPGLGLCYGHLKHHPEAPPSIRAKLRGGARVKGQARRRRAKTKTRTSGSRGAMRCESCGQKLTGDIGRAALILTEAGLNPEDAIRTARKVLQTAR